LSPPAPPPNKPAILWVFLNQVKRFSSTADLSTSVPFNTLFFFHPLATSFIFCETFLPSAQTSFLKERHPQDQSRPASLPRRFSFSPPRSKAISDPQHDSRVPTQKVSQKISRLSTRDAARPALPKTSPLPIGLGKLTSCSCFSPIGGSCPARHNGRKVPSRWCVIVHPPDCFSAMGGFFFSVSTFPLPDRFQSLRRPQTQPSSLSCSSTSFFFPDREVDSPSERQHRPPGASTIERKGCPDHIHLSSVLYSLVCDAPLT